MAFPKDQDVGPNCELMLWLTKYEDRTELSTAPRTLNQIYVSTPLIDLLTNEIYLRISEAEQAHSGPYISYDNAQAVIRAIDDYRRLLYPPATVPPVQPPAPPADARQPLNYFFSNAPSNETRQLFNALYHAGFYLPPFHKSQHAPDLPILERLTTGNFTIWNHRCGATTIGEMTFEDLFTTSAAYLIEHHPLTYAALSEAKRVGILRHHKDQGHFKSPLGTNLTILQGGNRKCCALGQCIESQYPADYCQTISGTTDCNAMSDACHV